MAFAGPADHRQRSRRVRPVCICPTRKVAHHISVIDTATQQRRGDIVVGQQPRGGAVDGKHLYLTDAKAGSLLIVTLDSGKLLHSVPIGDSTEGISLAADGKSLAGSVESDNSVILLSAPDSVATHPDGQRVFISNGRDGTVMAMDTASNTVVGAVDGGKRPWNMTLTPNGARLYVANGHSGSVSFIDTQSFTKLTDVKVGELP